MASSVVVVTFTRAYGTWQAGDMVSLDPDAARSLIRRGLATAAPTGQVRKRKSETAMQAPAPEAATALREGD